MRNRFSLSLLSLARSCLTAAVVLGTGIGTVAAQETDQEMDPDVDQEMIQPDPDADADLEASPSGDRDVIPDRNGSDASVTARIHTRDGEAAGTVRISQLAHGALFVAELENLPPGGHAFHVHEHGKCQPGFDAAGSHYNPAGAAHGLNNNKGYHAGDLPNIYASEQGQAKAAFFTPALMLTGAELRDDGSGVGPYPLLDGDGSAIVIHENPDDYLADPPDSSGARIACGVIAADGTD